MDKGLDIAELRCVLAFHAATVDSPRKLTELARVFVRSRVSGATIESTSRELGRAGKRFECELDWSLADRCLRWAESSECQIITIFDPAFPSQLAEIAVPPLVMFVRGTVERLKQAQIAIVGSRKGSHYGLDAAFEIAGALARHDITVTSGMASGIDSAAHRGALHERGCTIAVFGCGIDRIYPNCHRELAEEIALHGALISEFPLATPPRPYNFPRRNRLISGLSRGTLVVEAAARSGSMSTAFHALEQGRDVFALPGSVRNPQAAGCHLLIKQGAMLIDRAEDILMHYPDFAVTASADHARKSEKTTLIANEREEKLLAACGYDGATFDDIVRRVGLTATEVSSILSALEVRGLVRSLAGNTYLRIDA